MTSRREGASKLCREYLPPKGFLPQVCRLLPDLQYPERVNLAVELLDRNVAERGDRVAIYYDAERITYRELAIRVNRFANALRELGVGQEDRVVLRAVNIPEYVVWNFACWRIGQSAGEPLPVSTSREWRARFGQTILNSLGSGELHYWLTTTEDLTEDKFGCSGLSEPGYQNLVVDENLNPVPRGSGELIVRGPLGQLYWRRPDAQRKGVCPPDSRYAGWSRPGLHFVQDADGYFWYKSRTDDMIVTSGYRVPGGRGRSGVEQPSRRARIGGDRRPRPGAGQHHQGLRFWASEALAGAGVR